MAEVKPASTVDAPFLSEDAARIMPEFSEGREARMEGKTILECPYTIWNASASEQRSIPADEWRLSYENRHLAWMFGYNAVDA